MSFSQINIHSVEDLDCFHEEILGVPLLLRVWAEFQRNDYVGSAQTDARFEGMPKFIIIEYELLPDGVMAHFSILNFVQDYKH